MAKEYTLVEILELAHNPESVGLKFAYDTRVIWIKEKDMLVSIKGCQVFPYYFEDLPKKGWRKVKFIKHGCGLGYCVPDDTE